MKTRTRAVVIGGGIAGCSALYHLTKLGWTDVMLVERDELTSGSTWHAAGNCPTFATSWNVIKYHRYSNQLYARLAEDPGAVAPEQAWPAFRALCRERAGSCRVSCRP